MIFMVIPSVSTITQSSLEDEDLEFLKVLIDICLFFKDIVQVETAI